MVHKQISLPDELDQKIQERVKLLKASEERVIRELLETGLQTKQQQTGNVGEALVGLAKLGQELGITGPTDLSQNIDKYLYEED